MIICLFFIGLLISACGLSCMFSFYTSQFYLFSPIFELLIPEVIKWCKPDYWGWLKFNVYAALNGSAGGIGVVQRSHEGRFVGGFALPVHGLNDPEVVEVFEIKEVLNCIKDRRLQKVIVESDCISAVFAIKSADRLCSSSGLIFPDYKSILLTLTDVRVVFNRGLANSTVHNLARVANFCTGSQIWDYTPPRYISILLPI